jgi:macrolide transport system ATP-binding/permease protein
MPPEQPLLVLHHLSRKFTLGNQTITVLHNLSFTVHSGEMVAIIGASGSGKSTLMNLLGCLDHPTSGRYQVAGKEISRCTPNELAALRRESFGFIFQRYHLLPHLNAWQNVALAAHYAGIPADLRQQRAQMLLTQLGLARQLTYPPAKLSGGQQQRVSIARALMNGGQLILADEPTGALDSRSSQQTMAILHDLHSQGHTIIIVTHDEKIAAQTQRILTLCDGRLMSDHASVAPRVVLSPFSPPPKSSLTVSSWRTACSQGYELLHMVWLTMVAHPQRTFLTLLSLMIGIASVVSSTVIGEALQESMLKDFQKFAAYRMDIYPGKNWGDNNPQNRRALKVPDLHILQQQPFITALSPGITTSQPLRAGRLQFNSTVFGVSDTYFTASGIQIASGTPFTTEQIRRQASVAVVDHHVQQQLFPNQVSCIGQILLIGRVPVQIIGVTSREGSDDNDSALRVWIPYTMAASKLTARDYFNWIRVAIQDGADPRQLEQKIERLLTLNHGQKDFMILNFDQWLKTRKLMFAKLQRFLVLVALMTLLVGGLGIMNILLISVSERTREIGIRMAIGARQPDIQQQFLTEAVLICLIGGVGGIGLSIIIVATAQWLNPSWPITLAPLVVLAAVCCSTATGTIFGYLPARRAARLDPVEALMRE